MVELVKGGLIVDIGVRALLPADDLDSSGPENLARYVGESFEVRVVSLDRARGRARVSRTRATDALPNSPSLTAGLQSGDSLYAQAKRSQLIRKDLVEAEHLFLRAIQERDQYESSVMGLASIYVQLKRYEEAVTLLEACLRSGHKLQNRARVQDHLIRAYQAAGRHDRAVKLLELFIKHSGPERLPTLESLRILSITKLNGFEAAEQAARDLKESHPTSDWVVQLMKRLEGWRRQAEEGTEPQSGSLAPLPPLSAVARHALLLCEFKGLDASTLQTQRYTAQDIDRAVAFAKRAGGTRPRESAEYYLTAAAVANDIDNEKYSLLIRRCLGKYFEFTGDSQLLNEQLDAARASYAEALRLAIGTPVRDETQFLRLVGCYAGAWLTRPQSVLPNLNQRTYEEILNDKIVHLVTEPNRQLRTAVAHLAIVSPATSDAFWAFLENNKYARARCGVEVGEDWRALVRHVLASHDKVRSEFRHLERMELASLDQDHLLSEGESACPLELDRTRIRILHEIHAEVATYSRQTLFEEQERLFNRITTNCGELSDKIREHPTPFSVEEIGPWLETLGERVKMRYREIEASTTPALLLKLPLELVCPNDDGIVELQIEVENQLGCSPASHLSVLPTDDSQYFKVTNKVRDYEQPIRGGAKATFTIPLRVTPLALRSKAFPIQVEAIGMDRSGQPIIAAPAVFSVRLYSAADFEEIENPYAFYAGGTPVGAGEEKMFFGRNSLIDKLTRLLAGPSGTSSTVVLYGQKRSGKSTILQHLKSRLTFPLIPLEFSLTDCAADLSVFTFLYRIVQQFEFALEDLEDRHPPRIEIPRLDVFKLNPSLRFHELMGKFKRACDGAPGWADCRLVLLIDEFTYLHDAVQKGKINDDFMKTWKALVERGYFRAVLVGQDFMPRLKSKFPNEFGVTKDERVTYLLPEHARQLIEDPTRLNRESRFKGAAVDRIVELTAGSPYFLQIFCSHLIDFMNDRRAIYCTEADVEQVKNSLVRGVNALEQDKFDCLLSAGDEEHDQRDGVLHILRVIAANARTGWCTSASLTSALDPRRQSDLLKDLVAREVLEKKEGSDAYRIRVGLFQEWLAAH